MAVRIAERMRDSAYTASVALAQEKGAFPLFDANGYLAEGTFASRLPAALQQAILRQWIRPETVPLGQRCRISIRQLPGGEVVDVDVSASCPYDAAGRQSVERAVYKASPLPYAGFEAVFNRNLNLNFVAEDR